MATQVTAVGNLFKLEKTGEPTKYYNKKDVSVVFRGDVVQIGSEFSGDLVEYNVSNFSGSSDGTNFITYSTEESIANFLGTQMADTSSGGGGDVSEADLAVVNATALGGQAGYSHTGAFADKPLDNNYVWQAGAGIDYTQSDVDAELWKVFSLSDSVHAAVDNPYWSTPTPSGNTGIGLFLISILITQLLAVQVLKGPRVE